MIRRALLAVVVAALAVPTTAGATVQRQGPMLRIAGGGLLATTGISDGRLRVLDARTLEPRGPALRIDDDTRVWTTPGGRRVVVADVRSRGGGDRLTVTTRRPRDFHATGRATLDVRANVGTVVPVDDRLVLVQAVTRGGRFAPRVVFAEGGRVRRTVDLEGTLLDVRRLGNRVGVLVLGPDGVLRLVHWGADGGDERTVALPTPSVPGPDDADDEVVGFGLRYVAGRVVAFHPATDGTTAVSTVDLRTGDVTVRAFAADLGSFNGSLDVVMAREESVTMAASTRAANVLTTLGPRGSTTTTPLPAGAVTIASGSLLIDGPRLVSTSPDGLERWTTGTGGFDLAPSAAVIGDRVLHREDSGEARTAIRSMRDGRLLRRRSGAFSVLRRPVGTGGRAVYAAVPGELF